MNKRASCPFHSANVLKFNLGTFPKKQEYYSMCQWYTIFVEVPISIFNPVKTVADLLRPIHQ
ncbi:MAG: DUF4301 family protein [Bacteroidales bacterium]|nr:DUF4301 family protein [Bacteroidales bacterium]MBR2135674.1 DUF4301 family protein [Bacteroidales bacterium]